MSLHEEIREAFKRQVVFPAIPLDYWTFRKLRALKSRAVGDKGWDEWFKYLTNDVSLAPSIHERVQEGTQQTLLQTWMENFANNLPAIRFGDSAVLTYQENYHQQSIADIAQHTPILETDSDYKNFEVPEETHDNIKIKYPPKGSAVIIGRGPSLFRHNHLKLLADAQKTGAYTGLVVASDGGFIPALENGVHVDTVVTVDGAPVIKKYFEHPLVTKYGPEINWILSVTTNHEVYQTGKKAGLKIYWFNPMFDDWRKNESWTRIQRLLSRTNRFIRGIPAANSGGNAGACAWILAMELFKRSPICLIGIDFGYPADTPLEKTQYYSGMLQLAKGDVSIIKQSYKEFYHPVFKEKAYVDLVFYHYRQAFIEMQEETPFWYTLYGGTINCTEGGTLFGNNIACMPFSQFLGEHKK